MCGDGEDMSSRWREAEMEVAMEEAGRSRRHLEDCQTTLRLAHQSMQRGAASHGDAAEQRLLPPDGVQQRYPQAMELTAVSATTAKDVHILATRTHTFRDGFTVRVTTLLVTTAEIMCICTMLDLGCPAVHTEIDKAGRCFSSCMHADGSDLA